LATWERKAWAKKEKKKRRRFLGRESAKIGKRPILRFVCRSDSVYYISKKPNQRFAKHENQRRPSLSFTPCDASVSLIVRPFSQKYHFLYNRGMHVLNSHRKNGFVEAFENLTRYRSENNFVELLKLVARMSKLLQQCHAWVSYIIISIVQQNYFQIR